MPRKAISQSSVKTTLSQRRRQSEAELELSRQARIQRYPPHANEPELPQIDDPSPPIRHEERRRSPQLQISLERIVQEMRQEIGIRQPIVLLERIDLPAATARPTPSPPPQPPQDNNAAINSNDDDDDQQITPTPPRRRRRHADVPHRVTYNTAILMNNMPEFVPKYNLGDFNVPCRYCEAVYFEREPGQNRQGQRRSCCNLGEIVLPELEECPDLLRAYFTENNAEANCFRQNIRAINSVFAMASFKTNLPIDNRDVGQGHWSFRVCGMIYHYTEALPGTQDRRQPKLNQYYFVDAENAIERRQELLADRIGNHENIIPNLERMLRANNPWVQTYQTMKEVIDEKRTQGVDVNDMIIAFAENMQRNLRNFNLPESRSDVAAVFCGEEPPFNVDLKIYPRNVPNAVRELKNLNRLADPMVYPILFPKGEYGYDTAIKYRTRPTKTVSFREFYRHRIHLRPGQRFCTLHHGDKLFQQYLVDVWCKVEANELWWYKTNQNKLRVAGKQAIERMLEARAAEENMRVGKICMLPSHYQGSQRNQSRKYLDAMTIVSRLGKPDLFITMTCNPRWPEITDNLQGRQKWQHRPDLVVRVFHAKLTEFMDDINNKQIYGVVAYSMYVIEFQKRGLPHAHILVTLIAEDKPDTVEKIDSIVCAQLPDADTEPTLFALIAENYIHRPCGRENPNAPCMRDGRCSKRYPKRFREHTDINNDNVNNRIGQPEYKRPRDGRTAMVNGQAIDNRRVIPFNRYAAAKYQCHINFEICGSLHCIKYLHKYVYKGADCVTVQMGEDGETLNWDEIRNYVDCRYVSATEAAWRLFEYKMGDRTHAVLVLPVHLPDDNPVYFDEHETVEAIVNAANKPTKLMAYFALNAASADARQYRYQEIPENYTWNDRQAEWRPRVQVAKMFGCMAEVTPREPEKFYLRLLLYHVRGALSFQDLRTVRGVEYETFQEACRAHNLLLNIDEYDRCLAEALLFRTPKGFRNLFGLICVVAAANVLAQIPTLWQRHRIELMRDFMEATEGDEPTSEALALQHIADILHRNGEHTLLQFGLPPVEQRLIDAYRNNNDDEHRNDNEEEDAIYNNFPGHQELLNQEQRAIFDQVTACIAEVVAEREPAAARNNAHHLFYVDAPGGTGKTFLFNTIIKSVRQQHRRHSIAVAWTGIAASLLLGGRTCHRTFKLPLNITPTTPSCGHPLDSPQSNNIRDALVIVWDEAPMSPKNAVHLVDRYLRDVMNKNVPMGGKIVIFGGDFRQILPVVPRGHRTEVIGASLKTSHLWDLMQRFQLHRNVRAGEAETQYAEWLLQLGNGTLPHARINTGDITVPADLIEIPQQCIVSSKERMIKTVFGRRYQRNAADRVVLCPTNASVNEINTFVLNNMAGEERIYYSVDEYVNDENDELHVPQDYLHNVHVASLPPHELHLKIGAIVMLLRNLDVDMGQCNGARCRILTLGDHVIEVELLTGTHSGDRVLLPKIKMSARDASLPKEIDRTQFPVTLAFAMTINKSQGQTFQKVGIYLKEPCFAHGQLYVAFSRTGSLGNVFVRVENTTKQGTFRYRNGKTFTRNIVYETIVANNADRIILRDIAEEDGGGDDEDYDDYFQDLDAMMESLSSATEGMSMDDDDDDDQNDNVDDDMDCFVPQPPLLRITSPDMAPEERDQLERLLMPEFDTQQLAARVARSQQAGTSGLGLLHRPPVMRQYSSTDSE